VRERRGRREEGERERCVGNRTRRKEEGEKKKKKRREMTMEAGVFIKGSK
jgi:hypothetical protein